MKMKHKHHIIPRYEGGSDDKSNLVELTPTQHSMWHYASFLRNNDIRDWCASRMILGDVHNKDFRRASNKVQRMKLERQGRTIAEQQWLVTKPDGKQLVVTNLAKFCRDNNLLKSKMCLVSKGVYKQHRGYSVHKLISS